ncbi:MAG: DUF2155 domain-containing protein [Alphaproteobacteria bacterium]|nr:DUF2155 domain-containing protein [Alphaproteobacteria bacterium]
MKKAFLTIGLAGLLSVSFSSVRAEDISYGQVVLRGLDKVTGRLSTMTVNVGEKTTFGALDIYARVCYAHPPEETPENAAFLEIVEKKEEGQLKLFSGWMFSSSPALSAMDHAVYDVWVLKCHGDQVAPPAAEPLVLENPIALRPVQPKLKIIWDEEKQSVEDVMPAAEEEKPADPENTDEETAVVSDQEVQETESIVIHVEQPQHQEQTSPAVVVGGEGTETDMEPQEFRLIPIQEPAQTDDLSAPAAIETPDTADMPSALSAEEMLKTLPAEEIREDHAPDFSAPDILSEEVVQEEMPEENGGLFSEESQVMEKAIFSTDEY